jgi:hypothetical protein
MKVELNVALDDPKAATSDELSEAMEKELNDFRQWMMEDQKQYDLVPSEKTMIKTYIAWKIKYQD